MKKNLNNINNTNNNTSGIEVIDCMMIKDGDSLFLSNGESFISPISIKMKESESESYGNVETFCDQYSLPSVIGPFLVGKLLGKGGFGEVRLGTNEISGEKIALKFLRKSEIQSVYAAARTSTEMQCLTVLNHKNIINMSMVSVIIDSTFYSTGFIDIIDVICIIMNVTN